MKTLYIDNYKGFVDTYIPFEDVNFLVGNNSTGKTSVVNVITLISSPNFWMNPIFNTDAIEMGYYDDIVNKKAVDQSFFSIGAEFQQNDTPDFYLARFGQQNGIPVLKEYQVSHGGYTIIITIEKNVAICQAFKSDIVDFAEWVKLEEAVEFGDKITIKFPENTTPPLGILFNFLETKIDELQKKEKSEDVMSSHLKSIILDTMQDDLKAFAPIRAKAQRNYDSFKQAFNKEGEHIPVKLKDIFSSNKNKRYTNIQKKIVDFGKESGLFDNICIESYANKIAAPFSVGVVYDDMQLNLVNVGYGVSQVMPLVVDMATRRNTWFCMQQPEVHLHPKAQAAFGEYVYNSCFESYNKFIIETHSDYMINRFRYCLSKPAKVKRKKPVGQILFFERSGGNNHVSIIKLNNKGEFVDEIPENYNKFFIDENLKILGF